METGQWAVEQMTFLDICKDCSAVLTKLINDLLDLSKLELEQLDLHFTPVFMEKLLNEVMNPLHVIARRKGIALIQEVESTIPKCFMTDELRVVQVLNK
jgi:signal transduction histidine kinase